MKNVGFFLATLLMGATPIVIPTAAVASILTQENKENILGSEAIQSIRKAYNEGEFDSFLKEMDDAFQIAKEKNQLASLSEMRIGFTKEWQEWESRAQKLQIEKNDALLTAIQDQKNTSFVEKVRSAASERSDESHQKAVEKIITFRQMAPGSGQNADENRLIDLDLEYEYKALHLDLPGAAMSEKREQHCALKMDRLSRMLRESKNFKDKELANAISLYADNFDARLAQSWDLADLNSLANGRKKPSDALEELIASLFILYQEKFSDLTRQFIAEHEVMPHTTQK